MPWDVMHGGWLGPTMVLWCYWRLGGTTYLIWLFCYVMFLMLFPFDVWFRWLDFGFLCFYLLSVFTSRCGSSTPWCGGFYLCFSLLFVLRIFFIFPGRPCVNTLQYKLCRQGIKEHLRGYPEPSLKSLDWTKKFPLPTRIGFIKTMQHFISTVWYFISIMQHFSRRRTK